MLGPIAYGSGRGEIQKTSSPFSFTFPTSTTIPDFPPYLWPALIQRKSRHPDRIHLLILLMQ